MHRVHERCSRHGSLALVLPVLGPRPGDAVQGPCLTLFSAWAILQVL